MIGIYIHVPFCATKCPYCDFYSNRYSKTTAIEYGDAIVRNLRYYSKEYDVKADTLYFGGGTPSLMPIETLKQIVDTAKDTFGIDERSEVTLEANPRTLNTTKLEALRNMGINRLSIGVQSCVDSELKLLGRNNTFKDCKQTVQNAIDCGFNNISCDLMIGIPNQTMDTLEYSLNTLASLDIQHISSYMLKIEEGTPYSNDSIRSMLPVDDVVAEMYLKSVEVFKQYGYAQYEVSNFAKSGYQSRHNNKYWQCVDYLGIGCASHSCIGGKRFCVPCSTQEYISCKVQPIEVTEEHPYTFEEVGMLALRLSTGLDMSKYPKYKSRVLSKAKPLERCGYLNIVQDTISLTAKGFLVSNAIIETLIL